MASKKISELPALVSLNKEQDWLLVSRPSAGSTYKTQLDDLVNFVDANVVTTTTGTKNNTSYNITSTGITNRINNLIKIALGNKPLKIGDVDSPYNPITDGDFIKFEDGSWRNVPFEPTSIPFGSGGAGDFTGNCAAPIQLKLQGIPFSNLFSLEAEAVNRCLVTIEEDETIKFSAKSFASIVQEQFSLVGSQDGYITFPNSTLEIKWGRDTIPASANSFTRTFTSGLGGTYTDLFTVVCSGISSTSVSLTVNNPSASQFTVVRSGSTTSAMDFFWIAIGK